MNLLGKILTLLIFVMSLLFMFVAFMVAASHQAWKQQAIDNMRLANQRLENQKSIQESTVKYQKELEKERVLRSLLVQQLASQLTSAEEKSETAQQSLIEVQSALQINADQLQTAQARLAELDQINAELDGQNSKLIDLVANETSKVIELQTAVFAARSQVAQLEKLRDSLATSYARSQAVLRKLGTDEFGLLDDVPPPLNGIVASISGGNLVVSLGRDDGLLKGHTVDIFRDGQFKGQGTVAEARNNESVVRLNPRVSGNSVIRVGDYVTTKWSRDVAGGNENGNGGN